MNGCLVFWFLTNPQISNFCAQKLGAISAPVHSTWDSSAGSFCRVQIAATGGKVVQTKGEKYRTSHAYNFHLWQIRIKVKKKI